MTGWTRHSGRAAALPMESIDTDQLIPARFMSAPRSEGYGRFLLHDLRFDEAGGAKPFPLTGGESVLVTRRNFGSGSSREAAVYALVDYGIRAVIAPSFGDIFAQNAVGNGLLPARVEEDLAEALIAALEDAPTDLTVDLDTCRLSCGEIDGPFQLDPIWQLKLINGWDDIDLTLQEADHIAGFKRDYLRTTPWAVPTNNERVPADGNNTEDFP